MERLVDRDGRPLTLGVRSVNPERGHGVGVTYVTDEDREMATKAQQDDVYTLNGGRFVIAAGDPVPDGAVLDSVALNAAQADADAKAKADADAKAAAKADAEAKEAAEKAKGPAPENAAKGAAPENRSV